VADEPVIPPIPGGSGTGSDPGSITLGRGVTDPNQPGLVVTYNPYTHQYELDPPNTIFLDDGPVVPPARLRNTNNSKQQATVAGAGAVIPLIYGRRRVGGKIAGIAQDQGALYLLAVWCWGTPIGVDAVESFQVGNQTDGIRFSGVHYLGNQTAADPTIQKARGDQGKTYFDILPSVCYSVIGIQIETITGGLPTVNAVIRGLKVASSDGGTPAWSECPAYIVADFITNTDYGMGAAVDWDDVATVAAYNNELVGSGASAQVRNQLDISIDAVKTKADWLSVLCDYAGCFPYRDGDTWRLALDAPVSSSPIVVLTETDLVQGSLQLTKKDLVDSPSVMQVIWTDTTQTPWADSTAVAYAPGVLEGTTNRRVTQLDHRGTVRFAEANRYAIKRLNEALTADLSCQFTQFDSGLLTVPGGVFSLTHPIGLVDKLFRCISVEPTSAGRWAVKGSEYDPEKYSDVVVSTPSSPDSDLPNPLSVPDMSGLVAQEIVTQVQAGSYVSRLYMTWDGPSVTDWVSGDIIERGYLPLEGFDLLITQGGVTVVSQRLDASLLDYLTSPLPENLPYVISMRARSGIAQGAWSTANVTTLGKASLPSDVSAITGYALNGETRLSWTAPSDLDLSGYELRYGLPGSPGATWETATDLALVAAPATTYNTTVIPAGTWRIFIKALDSVRSPIDPNGQESADANFVDVEVPPNINSSFTNYDPGTPTLYNMIQLLSGHWVTDMGDVWDTEFSGTMDSYVDPVDSYHASETSWLVSDVVDLGATVIAALVQSTLAYTNITGSATPFIEYKVDSGDPWTRVEAQTAVATFRYVRVGITTSLTGNDTLLVTSLGVISVGITTAGNYIVGMKLDGAPSSSQVMIRHVFPGTGSFLLPVNAANSAGKAATAATAQTDFDIQKNGSSVGTLRFAASGTVATFVSVVATTFDSGDVLTVIAPASPDATLADLTFSISFNPSTS
jgi:hypothetical protein